MLATESPIIGPCFKYLSTMSKAQAQRIEGVLQDLHGSIYQQLCKHIVDAVHGNGIGRRKDSLEMSLHRTYNKLDINLFKQKEPNAPWDNLLYLLFKVCVDVQVSLVKTALVGSTTNRKSEEKEDKVIEIRSEIQRFVGWAVKKEMDFHRNKTDLNSMRFFQALNKMVLKDDDLRKEPEEYKNTLAIMTLGI